MQKIRICHSIIPISLFSLLIISLLLSTATAQTSNLYRNNTHSFSIIFPQGWIQRSGHHPNTVVISEDTKGAQITIQVFALPGAIGDMTLDQYPESKLKLMIHHTFQEIKNRIDRDAVLEKSGITYICNKKSIWMLTSHTREKSKVMTYAVWGNGKQYEILCSAPINRYGQYQNIFLNSVRTFLF
jgi:hypothetical protein